MSSTPKHQLTEAEYLAIERRAEFRSEFYRGEMFAMAGTSRHHNRIVTNLVARLDQQLRDRPCNVYSNDMRILIPNAGLYTYPDIVITCGTEQFLDDTEDTLLNPLVIIEVLSDSTEAYDRGRKFEQYQKIASLQTYVLVAQNAQRVEQYARQADSKFWTYSESHEAGDVITIGAINCELKLEDVYSKVEPTTEFFN
ncbi:MAG: Uma2 family endonuclease [Acidobacteria bacterium]|nr:Uma2 family endonuclease [Acidobacteriota bacterium]